MPRDNLYDVQTQTDSRWLWGVTVKMSPNPSGVVKPRRFPRKKCLLVISTWNQLQLGFVSWYIVRMTLGYGNVILLVLLISIRLMLNIISHFRPITTAAVVEPWSSSRHDYSPAWLYTSVYIRRYYLSKYPSGRVSINLTTIPNTAEGNLSHSQPK